MLAPLVIVVPARVENDASRDSFQEMFHGVGVPYGIINLRNLEEGVESLEGIPRRRDVIDNGKGEVISV